MEPESFAVSFLEEHGIDYEKARDGGTNTHSHNAAEEGASSFVDKGGDPESRDVVYGLLLDELRAFDITKLEYKCAVQRSIKGHLQQHKAQLSQELRKSKKVVIEDQVRACVREYETRPMSSPNTVKVLFPSDVNLKKRELMMNDNIAWIKSILNNTD